MEVVLSDQIKDAIVALQGGNSSQFKDAITSDLMARAMDAIEVERVGAGQNFFAQPEAEAEVEPDAETVEDLFDETAQPGFDAQPEETQTTTEPFTDPAPEQAPEQAAPATATTPESTNVCAPAAAGVPSHPESTSTNSKL